MLLCGNKRQRLSAIVLPMFLPDGTKNRDHISPKINRAYIILGVIKRNIKEIESVQKEQRNW